MPITGRLHNGSPDTPAAASDDAAALVEWKGKSAGRWQMFAPDRNAPEGQSIGVQQVLDSRPKST